MRNISAKIGVAALASVLLVGLATSPANAAPSNEGYGKLELPDGPASWLINHYDNRTVFAPFVPQVIDSPTFDDSAEVKFSGTIAGIGKVTVEQSAAWTFTTFGADGGGSAPFTGPCAVVYDESRTLVKIHTHQGVSTTAPPSVANLLVAADFPFTALGVAADGMPSPGTHTFTATFTVTTKGGSTIFGIVEGGTNCQVDQFTTGGGHPPAGVFDFTHEDTNNTVQTALEIIGGTDDFDGATGTGVLSFTYDTFEPHGLIEAHIVLNLD